MRKFTVPRAIYIGENALEGLRNIEGDRALVITDPVVESLGFADQVARILRDSGKEVQVWAGAKTDPTRTSVDQSLPVIMDFGPDLVVGVGGGSAMDTAKAMWARYEHPDLKWEEFKPWEEFPRMRGKARFAAVATTAGTASEVTACAVISNDTISPPQKEGLLSHEISADVAVAPPEFTVSMPPHLTAWVGFDVLSHAMESFENVQTNDISDVLALGSVRTAFKWLPLAVNQGDNMLAREKMQIASVLAGMAMANSGTGIGHSMGHTMGTVLGLHHGLGCGLAMSVTLEFNAVVLPEKTAEMAYAIGLRFDNELDARFKLLEAFDQLKRDCGFPRSIREAGVDEKVFREKFDTLVDYSFSDGCTSINPRKVTREDMIKCWSCAWEGELLNDS